MRKKINISKNLLIKEYKENKKPIDKISKMLGCSRDVIWKRLKEYKIKINSYSAWNKDTGIKTYCYDCHKQMPQNSKGKRCNKCHQNYIKKNPIKSANYKDGRTLQKYYCKNYGIEIHWHTFCYGTGFCLSCSISKERNGNYKHGRCFNNKCIDCDKIISYYNKRCRKCDSIQTSLRQQGSKNSFWKGGSSTVDYPIEWTKNFKDKIRARDNFTCQECGKKQVECRTKLHVHHIDYDKENLDPKNLISLCSKCHAQANGNRKYWKKHFKLLVFDLVLV